MSAVARALSRLAEPRALLAPVRTGAGYGVFLAGDRRRRAVARLTREEVRELVAAGALSAARDVGTYVLSAAGDARVRREAVAADDAFLAQHAPIVARTIVKRDGGFARARGVEANAAIKRLAGLRDAAGASWLNGDELAVATRLRADWEAGQAGLLRGSDWSAPPQSGGARGPGNAVENALLRNSDARRRVAEALDALAPMLRRVVERVCLHEDGLEALERAEGWPARSGKLALKLGLAQLAQRAG
ncbi:MAG: hypothetical protein J0L81_07820 [Caulobacterales bacterium]|jgi:hypothetical protein|nr:hypothetical protein [Caulobacterales bacterium]